MQNHILISKMVNLQSQDTMTKAVRDEARVENIFGHYSNTSNDIFIQDMI